MPLLWRLRFRASFKGRDILEALVIFGGGGYGRSWVVRQWEVETIVGLGWTEAAWCRLSLEERARKVCGHKLREWQQALETEVELARIRAGK